MSTAASIAALAKGSASASFQYGQIQHYQSGRFCRTNVEPGKVILEKRNRERRCTYQKLQYADGSILEFRWSPVRGSRFIVS